MATKKKPLTWSVNDNLTLDEVCDTWGKLLFLPKKKSKALPLKKN